MNQDDYESHGPRSRPQQVAGPEAGYPPPPPPYYGNPYPYPYPYGYYYPGPFAIGIYGGYGGGYGGGFGRGYGWHRHGYWR
ncbi:MAG: hypothetical protein ACRD4Y_15000 [Candidatus Acidiferrales bacterium]